MPTSRQRSSARPRTCWIRHSLGPDSVSHRSQSPIRKMGSFGVARSRPQRAFHRGKVAPEVGLEPTTKRLTAARSTTELLGNGAGWRVREDRTPPATVATRGGTGAKDSTPLLTVPCRCVADAPSAGAEPVPATKGTSGPLTPDPPMDRGDLGIDGLIRPERDGRWHRSPPNAPVRQLEVGPASGRHGYPRTGGTASDMPRRGPSAARAPVRPRWGWPGGSRGRPGSAPPTASGPAGAGSSRRAERVSRPASPSSSPAQPSAS